MVVGPQITMRLRALRRNARVIAGVFVLSAALYGCSSIVPQTAALRDHWPADLPASHEIAEVPFFPQVEYQCGPAALATVLTHAGAPVLPDELVPQVYIPARQGSVAVEMLAAPRRYGVVPHRLQPQLVDVLREVAAGNPVVVLQNYGSPAGAQWHYAVIVGFESRSGYLLLRSGETKELREHLTIFEYTWKDGGRWAMVALPPDRIPASAEPESYFQSIVAVERAGGLRTAAVAYARFLERWPGHLGASVGLANAHYALGELPQAEAALRAALARHPDSIVVLNNLAHTISESGRSEEALALIDRAKDGGQHEKAVAETRALILQRLQRQ